MGDNNLNFMQIENLDPTEEELGEHWYIDLFKRIEHSEVWSYVF